MVNLTRAIRPSETGTSPLNDHLHENKDSQIPLSGGKLDNLLILAPRSLRNIPRSGDYPFICYTHCVRFHFKRFLLILMMLVLPVQTFASAAMLGCTHQGPSSAPEMAGMVMTAATMPACHEPQHPAAPAKHDCKRCAACYLSAALPIPSAVIVPIALPAQSVIVQPPASFVGFISDSPDRPPRTISL